MGGAAGLLCGRLRPRFWSCSVEALPDLGTLSDQELRDLIRELMVEEHKVSYERRLLHGKIDILRAELQARLQKQVGEAESPLARDRRRPAGGDPRLEGAASDGRGARRGQGGDARPLPRVRLPEPGGRQLLLEVRRAAHPRGAGRAHDDDVHARGGRRGRRPRRSRISASRGRRSSSARAAAGRGRRSRSSTTARRSGGRPSARSSSTTSRSRAATRSSRAAPTASRSTTRAASTARTSTAAASRARSSRTGTKCRSASTS